MRKIGFVIAVLAASFLVCYEYSFSKTHEKSKPIFCNLTNVELQKRKAGIIQLLKQEIKEKKELSDGYALSFSAKDGFFDQIVNFIKLEMQCCSFISFTVKLPSEKNSILLEMTGPEGTKNFIKTEMGF